MPKQDDLNLHKLKIEEFLKDPTNSNISPLEIAKAFKDIKKVDKELFIKHLKEIPNEYIGDIALELPDEYLKDLLREIPKSDLVEAVEELESDDATDLIQEIEDIDKQKANEILSSLNQQDQEEIKKLKSYKDDVAGAYMQTELFWANYEEIIEDSIKRLKQEKEKKELENIYQVYITGTFNRLLFAIALEDLITFDFSKTYKEILSQDKDKYKPIYARDTDDIKKVAQIFQEHDLPVLPIVNYHGELVGRITADDIHDVIEERATEQIYNLAGVDDEAEEEESLFQAGKSRATWLFINLLTAIAASIVIGFFQDSIQAYVALAVLMPIVASMGGNAGTQTLTVTVRQLALGDIELTNAKETIKKEVTLSLANGFIFAFVLGIIAYVWFHQALLGVVIAISMVINLFFAGFFGAVIPLLLKKANIDPAVGSSVVLTTITDVVGFFSFLGLASWILL